MTQHMLIHYCRHVILAWSMFYSSQKARALHASAHGVPLSVSHAFFFSCDLYLCGAAADFAEGLAGHSIWVAANADPSALQEQVAAAEAAGITRIFAVLSRYPGPSQGV